MDYSYALAGSPLLPFDLLFYLLGGLLVLAAVFHLIQCVRHPQKCVSERVKLLLKPFFTLLFLALLGLAAVTGVLLLPSPQVISAPAPANVSPDQKLEIVFDRPVSRRTLEKSISPEVPGVWLFESALHRTHLMRRLTFYPHFPLSPNTEYTITLSGITNTLATVKPYTQTFNFTTLDTHQTAVSPSPVTKLNVPAYLQKYSLSCELASLRMVLAFYQIKVSEDDLIAKVGFDPTAHQGNIWGNPHQAFVGDIKGRQMTTGYGVYWGPIARVANTYRPARAFSGWTISQLTREIANRHPVIIWAYSKGGLPVTWKTPDGQTIQAVTGEHTVVVVGFVGAADNPTHLIVNDSLIGQAYWDRSLFTKKWSSLGNSGVVVF